jgi:hypothetical protein
MKGVVFTEFLDYVATGHGEDLADDIIDDCKFSHGGAYTSVSTYPHQELVQLVVALSKRAGEPAGDILIAFGLHLSRTFAKRFPVFFEQKATLFDFLDSVEDTIHVEVRKLYPDAELPRFETRILSQTAMTLDYRSSRCFSGLAQGLIQGAAHYYDTEIDLTLRPASEHDGSHVQFAIELRA